MTDRIKAAIRGHHLTLVAVALGLGIVTVVHGTFWVITGSLGNNSKLSTVVLQAVVVAAPFTVLAFRKLSAREAWLIIMGLTAAVWGSYLYDEIRCWLDEERLASGTVRNLMAVSPFLLSLLAFGLNRKTRP